LVGCDGIISRPRSRSACGKRLGVLERQSEQLALGVELRHDREERFMLGYQRFTERRHHGNVGGRLSLDRVMPRLMPHRL
jgi:hypothetical protein